MRESSAVLSETMMGTSETVRGHGWIALGQALKLLHVARIDSEGSGLASSWRRCVKGTRHRLMHEEALLPAEKGANPQKVQA